MFLAKQNARNIWELLSTSILNGTHAHIHVMKLHCCVNAGKVLNIQGLRTICPALTRYILFNAVYISVVVTITRYFNLDVWNV